MRASLKRITGNWAGALNDYSLAIEQKADDGELYEQRAMMRLYTRGDAGQILADLDAAISYGRKHEKVYATRANIRMQMRDMDGAISDFETAIGLKPDYAGAIVGLASLYSIQRNDAKAVEILENFIARIENSDVKLEPVKGKVTASSGGNQVPNISGDKNVLITEGSVIIEGVEGKSTTGGRKMTLEEGEESAFKLEQTKNTAGAYQSLAAIYRRQNNLEKASQLIEKALKLDPQGTSSLVTRGDIRTDSGDYSGAIADYDAALKLMPNVPQFYLSRGIAKMLGGNEAEALKDFDKYLQLFPNGKVFLDREIAKAREKMKK